jgi:hypothetical protein
VLDQVLRTPRLRSLPEIRWRSHDRHPHIRPDADSDHAWCPPFSGYHIWYPSRRQSSAAFALVVEGLRYRV